MTPQQAIEILLVIGTWSFPLVVVTVGGVLLYLRAR